METTKIDRSQVFYKTGLLKVVAKFTEKQVYRSLAFNFIKKETLTGVFSCEFCKMFVIIIIIIIIINLFFLDIEIVTVPINN